ncbi:MAG TPA: sulfotransferase family 2 domain-containing protein [Flavobacteriaceae bacterium]
MKESIIFLHLPKNGGTTFHSILNRLYHNEKVFSLTYDNAKSNKDEFINLSEKERHQFKILKGHAPFGLHHHMKDSTKYVTFLRKPEKRIASFYYYVLRKPGNKLYKDIVENNYSLTDFVREIKSLDINNCQVRWISGINDKEEFMLEKAIENIETHFSFVGLTERYDESLIYLKNMYNWSIPYYKTKNKATEKQKNIDIETLNVINDYNRQDNILYDYIESKFDAKLKDIDNLQIKMLQLKLANFAYSNSYLKSIGGFIKKSIS